MTSQPYWASLGSRARAAADFNRSLLSNAGAMIGAAAATSGLGAVFWLVAAQNFDQSEVGVAGAAVSAMTLLGFTATLGLGTLLMGELPRRETGRSSLISAALVVNLVIGAILGLGFALIAPLVSSNLNALDSSVLAVVLFAAGAGLTAVGFVLDQALIGLLRGRLQLIRNVIFAVAKLLALIATVVLVADADAPWIYAVWTGGIALSLIVVLRLRARKWGAALRPDFAGLLSFRSDAASHAAVNLGLETADLAMPILVVILLSASANAAFFVAWMIVGFLVVIPLSLSSVAYAIGSGDRVRLAERFRLTFRISLAFGVISNLILIGAADPVLAIFGEGYADQGAGPLHILALGALPLAVKTHYVAIHRMLRQLGKALPLVWAGTFLELGGGAIGAELGGLSGVAWGWLAGLCIEGLVMGPSVSRAMRRGGLNDAGDGEGAGGPSTIAAEGP